MPSLSVIRRMSTISPEEQCTTAITYGEMAFGAERTRSERFAERVRMLIEGLVTILPFDTAAARTYASIRADLETQGQRLDEPDLRIAAIALQHDLTLVTGNVRHFARVPGLRVENWLA